jgi:RNA polymerase sigma-70 factor, ECF subfamily
MLKELKFKSLINQHKNRVYNYSFYMLGNRFDADDITQEVLIRTWKNMDKFNYNSAKAWMMTTAHNLCIDYLRKNKKSNRRTKEIDEVLEEKLPDRTGNSSPDGIVHEKILDQKLKDIINCLPESVKSPFILYQFEGLKYKEISQVLNIPLNSVRVYILRARKKLQEELKEFIYEKDV